MDALTTIRGRLGPAGGTEADAAVDVGTVDGAGTVRGTARAPGARRPAGAGPGPAVLAVGVPLAGAVLHGPAVGSLLPGLLAPVAAAFAQGGVVSVARTLYGPAWDSTDASVDPGRG